MNLLATTGLVVVFATTMAFGQAAKPSPYTPQPNPYEGVSHPPDEAITTNDLPSETSASSMPSSANATAAPSVSTAPQNNATFNSAVGATSAPSQTFPSVQHPGLMTRPASDTADSDVVTHVFPPPPPDDSDVVTSVPAGKNQLPVGTILLVSLNQQLSTATTQPGSLFSAHVIQPILKDGRIVIPVGSTMTGRVTYISEGRRITGGAAIHLRPDEVVLPDGTRYFLHAEVYDLGDPSKVKSNSEGDVVQVAHGKRALSEAGLLGGGAAAAGFMIAGGPAALIAGGAAAGYVGAHWLLENKQAVLPKDSEVVFGLTQPMTLVAFR